MNYEIIVWILLASVMCFCVSAYLSAHSGGRVYSEFATDVLPVGLPTAGGGGIAACAGLMMHWMN